MNRFLEITTIGQLHELLGCGKPRHPLVTVIDYAAVRLTPAHYDVRVVTSFYTVSLKSPAPKSLRYGRQLYDFEEGSLVCMAPGQVFSVGEFDETETFAGWGVYFHPNLLLKTPLAATIKDYGFFSYAAHEALHVSDHEKQVLTTVVNSIAHEYGAGIDGYSQRVLVALLEWLLTLCQRGYARQFITHTKQNTDVLARFEQALAHYFAAGLAARGGLPSVDYFAAQLHLSARYLTDLLRKETGRGTKDAIQAYVVEQAKQKLLASNETVSEVAYGLGFEYPQYFSRLFKANTGLTPMQYRQVP